MEIQVLLFGQLREVVGASQEVVQLSDGATAADLVALYRKRYPKLEEVCPRLAMAVNQEYANGSAVLHAGDEVALLPPVSGGQGVMSRVELTRDVIDPEALSAGLGAPADGAVATFAGIARRWTGERETLWLEYQAYEQMAQTKLEQVATEVQERFELSRIVIVHRLGRVAIGETSVFIAAASPHRAAAFDACRAAIDTLKRTVPIWKRECLADGAIWADGELPPQPVDAQPTRSEQ